MHRCVCIHFSGDSVLGPLRNGYTESNKTQSQGLQKHYLLNMVNFEGKVWMMEVEVCVCVFGGVVVVSVFFQPTPLHSCLRLMLNTSHWCLN